MSFELYGGLIALDFIRKEQGAPRPQAESVAEPITRQQGLGESGKITTLGKLVQLATIRWPSCFAATIREENGLKQWAHNKALGEEDFWNGVLANKRMESYD
ncbi:MAG: hypothetical protein M1832_004891 [Thelocarpon impressellum]|nr:MAG: hypothetical protein M1832_004891 [Thelocarpon impressellum]